MTYFFIFFITGEPKIGVYMLNSGVKKLCVKVRSYLLVCYIMGFIAIITIYRKKSIWF